MTRADRIAAALERWEACRIQGTIEDAFEIGNEMARLLRESQPEPVVGDDDAALLAKTQDWLCHNLTVTPDSHYRNVQALLERCSAALADVARLDHAIASWKREEEAWIEREKELTADVARLQKEKAVVETKLEQANEILAVDGREVE